MPLCKSVTSPPVSPSVTYFLVSLNVISGAKCWVVLKLVDLEMGQK
jgi:hypothetical protein